MKIDSFENARIVCERRFLLEDFPAPLTRADEHLQFFDNFLTKTDLLLRRIRVPQTRQWTRKIVKQSRIDALKFKTSEIELTEYEYEVLSIFEGNELRFNRYFHESDNQKWQIDFILNRELWNLILANIQFDSDEAAETFIAPGFVGLEITDDEFFANSNLADSTLEDVKNRINQKS